MNTVDRIYEQLRQIQDPCSIAAGKPIDIVKLGLIGAIDQDSGGKIRISLVLTEPACWFSKNIVEMVEQAVQRVDGVAAVEASLDVETIWTPDRMS